MTGNFTALKAQITAYAMFHIPQLMVGDPDEGYAEYAAYQWALAVAEVYTLEELIYIVQHDDLDTETVLRRTRNVMRKAGVPIPYRPLEQGEP